MTRKTRKKSSKTRFLLYAVIWGLLTPVLAGSSVFADDVTPPPALGDKISSLDDPFDVRVKAPEIVELFLQGLAEAKRQREAAEAKPVQETPAAVPVVPKTVVIPVTNQAPVTPKKLAIPDMKVTGVVYDTDRPQAIINGKVVSEGDIVDGVEIVRIRKGSISTRYEGADITLKLDKEE